MWYLCGLKKERAIDLYKIEIFSTEQKFKIKYCVSMFILFSISFDSLPRPINRKVETDLLPHSYSCCARNRNTQILMNADDNGIK